MCISFGMRKLTNIKLDYLQYCLYHFSDIKCNYIFVLNKEMSCLFIAFEMNQII